MYAQNSMIEEDVIFCLHSFLFIYVREIYIFVKLNITDSKRQTKNDEGIIYGSKTFLYLS